MRELEERGDRVEYDFRGRIERIPLHDEVLAQLELALVVRGEWGMGVFEDRRGRRGCSEGEDGVCGDADFPAENAPVEE